MKASIGVLQVTSSHGWGFGKGPEGAPPTVLDSMKAEDLIPPPHASLGGHLAL